MAMKPFKCCLWLCLSILSSGGYAQDIALQHARVIDGTGGPVMEHATVLISRDRIAAVGPDGQVNVPPDAKLIDLSGKTVLPGLISDHSHLGLVNGIRTGTQVYTRENMLRQLRQYQRYGVTTVFSMGMNGPTYLAVREQAHAGTIPGADTFGADRGYGVPDGAPPVDVAPDQLYRPTTVAEARQQVEEAAARHPDLIKLWVDDFHGTLRSKMTPEMYRAVIDEAHKRGLRVAAHVYYLADAKQLVADGVDVLAHGVRDQPVDDAFIAAMKSHGVWYIPTLTLDEDFYVFAQHPAWMDTTFFREAVQPALAAQFNDPAWQKKALEPKSLATNEASVKNNLANLKRLNDAGVLIGFGTDSGASPMRIPGFAEHRELQLYVQAGLTPAQAIHLATGSAAALLKLDDRGVIRAGKRADLLVVEGDPSQNIADIDRIEAVYQRGREVSGAVDSWSGTTAGRHVPTVSYSGYP
jgi:imidazolonepropionase-like amidohydrolase